MDFGIAKAQIHASDVSHNKNISFSYSAIAKHTRNSTRTVPLNKQFQNPFTVRLDVFCSHKWKTKILIYATLEFWQDLNEVFYYIKHFGIKRKH